MAVFQPAAPNLVTMGDLDGFSVSDDFYHTVQSHQVFHTTEEDDFGFDPPSKSLSVKSEHSHTPPQHHGALNSRGSKPLKRRSPVLDTVGLDRLAQQKIPNVTIALSRYGQVTPPRSNSTTSVDQIEGKLAEHPRRAGRAGSRDDHHSTTATGRKRRSTRKLSPESIDTPEEDDKRKQSLEKNRLAAAKCRVNKKEKTEQLQRDSHDKAVQNAYLKDQLLRMKEEVQQMNALLLAHANCDGCESPEEIQRHLTHLGHEFYAQQIASMTQSNYPAYPADLAQYKSEHVAQSTYLSPINQSDFLHPPLPDFDRESNFDMATPMHTD